MLSNLNSFSNYNHKHIKEKQKTTVSRNSVKEMKPGARSGELTLLSQETRGPGEIPEGPARQPLLSEEGDRPGDRCT